VSALAWRRGEVRADGAAEHELGQLLRGGMGWIPNAVVTASEVTEHSNFNRVYHVRMGPQSVYVKLIETRPKNFTLPFPLPRERIFSEAAAMRLFRSHCGGAVAVPRVLFVDRRRFALVMSDVGRGRRVLLDVLDQRYDLLVEQAAALGRGLAAVHRSTRGSAPLRPPAEDELARQVIFGGLLEPGVAAVAPGLWPDLAAEMQGHERCLLHADLWGKNLLVKARAPIAVVDFEGAFVGDPAFDLGTVLAMARIPTLVEPSWERAGARFARRLVDSYQATWNGSADGAAVAQVVARACRYCGVFLAARGFGPFAYPLSAAARGRVGALARRLLLQPPAGLTEYLALAE
jgi:aminoglycoside phosphotransferase (APT) family kinase protein